MELKTGDGFKKANEQKVWWSFLKEEHEIWRSLVKEECEIWRSFIKREAPSEISRAIVAKKQWRQMVGNIVYLLAVTIIVVVAVDYIDQRIIERHRPKAQQVSSFQQFL